jgi:Transglutaminase-like superfamily/TgpA N-terminal domain
VRRLVVFLPALLAAAAIASVSDTRNLPEAARVVAIAFAVGAFLVGALGTRPEVRSHATVALGAAAVTAAGQTRTGTAYVVVCVAFAFVSVVSIRLGRGVRTPRYRGPKSAVLVLGAVGALVAAACVYGLPPLAARIENRLGRYGDPDDMAVGFSSHLALGSTQGMMRSKRIVLRVHGEPVDYLRGALLDKYEGRVWTSTLAERSQQPQISAALGETRTRLVFAPGAPIAKAPDTRWFLPANACKLHTKSGRVVADGMGIASPATPDETEIALASCERPTFAPPPPSETDLEVPSFLGDIERIAVEWTRGATTDRAKLDAITRELHGFGYSLWVDRGKRDPVVDFLTVNRRGHCELFASALALLARTRGIPTRVVTGYRVTEASALFGHAVVRERNAHAWVEAWVDGGWRAWDPTPAEEDSLRVRPGLLDRMGEVLSYLWDIGLDLALGATFLLLALVYYGRAPLQELVLRYRRRRGAAGARSLPSFERLESALAAAGHVRPHSEPLERFARRLRETEEAWSGDVIDALGSYARLRYGGLGEEEEVAKVLERAALRITSSSAQP